MPRGTSRIFREKVRSAAKVLGVDGTDFRNAGRGFIERARDAYADLGFAVTPGGGSSRIFRAELELANEELGITAFTPQAQTIDFDAGEGAERMLSTSALIGIGATWTAAAAFKANNVGSQSGTIFSVGSGNVANRIQCHYRHAGPTGPLAIQLLLSNFDNSVLQTNVSWRNITFSNVWHHVLVQWDGLSANLKLYFDGVDRGSPDFVANNVNGAMIDTARAIGVGAPTGGVGQLLGVGAFLALWDSYLGSAEVVEVYNDGDAVGFNLRQDSGNYASSANLKRLFEVGKQASPNLGVDSIGTIPVHDLIDDATNIDDADRVADSPHGQQQLSIDFDGAGELMQSAVQSGGVIGIGGTFSLAVWFNPNVQPLIEFHAVCDIGPDAGQVNEIGLFLRDTGAGTNSIQFLLGDSGGTFIQSVAWSGLLTAGTPWRHVVLTWSGFAASRTMYFDGVQQGAPDFTGIDLNGTLDDTNSRRMRVGATRFGVQGMDGRVASVAWWNGIQLPALEVAAIFNSRDIDFDLNTNQGNYASAASLAHWHEVGKQPSPNLGKDTAALAGTAIDIEAAAVSITDADRVVDVP